MWSRRRAAVTVLKGFTRFDPSFARFEFSYSEEGEAYEAEPRHVLNGFSLEGETWRRGGAGGAQRVG